MKHHAFVILTVLLVKGGCALKNQRIVPMQVEITLDGSEFPNLEAWVDWCVSSWWGQEGYLQYLNLNDWKDCPLDDINKLRWKKGKFVSMIETADQAVADFFDINDPYNKFPVELAVKRMPEKFIDRPYPQGLHTK